MRSGCKLDCSTIIFNHWSNSNNSHSILINFICQFGSIFYVQNSRLKYIIERNRFIVGHDELAWKRRQSASVNTKNEHFEASLTATAIRTIFSKRFAGHSFALCLSCCEVSFQFPTNSAAVKYYSKICRVQTDLKRFKEREVL